MVEDGEIILPGQLCCSLKNVTSPRNRKPSFPLKMLLEIHKK